MTESTRTIKEICEAYGITQTELARKYGVPLRTVQDWHGGRRTPPDYVVNMIERLLAQEYPYARATTLRDLEVYKEKLNAARMEAIEKGQYIGEDRREELQARLAAGENPADIFKPNK